MKGITFLVLLLGAAVIAQDSELKLLAEEYMADGELIQMCLEEAETNAREMHIMRKKLEEMTSEEDMDQQTSLYYEHFLRFFACLLEKKEMMKDSKLVADKIVEKLEIKEENRDAFTKYVTTLNEDSELNREDRAMKILIWLMEKKEIKE